jgi:hypothetical protein
LCIGITHCAVRWNSRSSATRSAMAPVICTPVDPLPIRPTRAPSIVTEWSHRALWNDGPAKESSPSMSGSRGWCSTPVAATTTSKVPPPPEAVLTRHSSPSSSHATTSSPKRTRSSTPLERATPSK